MAWSRLGVYLGVGLVCAVAAGGPRAPFFQRLRTERVRSVPELQWQPLGPGLSGYLDKFWIHPTDPNVMFMALDMGNSHGTWDRGRTWHTIRDSDGTDEELSGITAVAFSHQDPDYGLLLDKAGVYVTEDRGHRWRFLVDTDPESTAKHSVLAVDPRDDRNWYIGAGQHWMIKYTHFNRKGLVYTSDRNHSEGFVLKSTDRGRSWTRIHSVFPRDADFSRILVDPRNGRRVYASCQHGLYRSDDAGWTWAKVCGRGLPHDQPRDLTSFYDPGTGRFRLYLLEVTHYQPDGRTIACTGGVFRSDDGGDSWQDLTGDLALDLNEVTSWAYRERYWRAVAFWLERPIAEVKRDYPELPRRIFSQFIALAVDPDDADRIYLVHNFKHDYSFPPGNLWMTEDGGRHWLAAAREGPYWSDPPDAAYWGSRGNPLGMNATFAHVQREHAERDNTQTGPRLLAINTRGEVYTAFAQQLMRSTDDGRTWVQVDDDETAPGSAHWVGRGGSNLPGETLCVETGIPGRVLFGSGEHGLWRNTDDGGRVRPGAIAVEQLAGQSVGDDEALSISAIAVHPRDPHTIYTLQFRQTQRGRLRRSTDGGRTWETLSQPIRFPGANDHIKQYSLLIDPVDPEILTFCVPRSDRAYYGGSHWIPNGPRGYDDYGIFQSRDGGRTWRHADAGIPERRSVFRLAGDPGEPAVLYAALNQTHDRVSGGLYRSEDRGGSWRPVSLPPAIESVNHVVVDPATRRLFIACGTYRADAARGGAWVSDDGGRHWDLLFDMPHVRTVAPSPVDARIIAVNVGQDRSIASRNPGVYVTLDGGLTWDKINHDLGQPGRVNVLAADPHDPHVLWCGLYGTGFWRADLSILARVHARGRARTKETR